MKSLNLFKSIIFQAKKLMISLQKDVGKMARFYLLQQNISVKQHII